MSEETFAVSHQEVEEAMTGLANHVRRSAYMSIIESLRELAQDERDSLTWRKRIIFAYISLFRPGTLVGKALDAAADGLERAVANIPTDAALLDMPGNGKEGI